jgi:hypothetical protein
MEPPWDYAELASNAVVGDPCLRKDDVSMGPSPKRHCNEQTSFHRRMEPPWDYAELASDAVVGDPCLRKDDIWVCKDDIWVHFSF